jgi:hypothetical protein
MKVVPFLLLGLLILPESINIFPFGVANAHPIHAPALNETEHMNLTHEFAANSTSHTETAVEEKNPLECDACMFLANGLNQTIIHNPKVVSFVTTDIEQICQVLPSSVQQLCISAAEQAVPTLLNHLGDFVATEGCSDLGICHNTHS